MRRESKEGVGGTRNPPIPPWPPEAATRLLTQPNAAQERAPKPAKQRQNAKHHPPHAKAAERRASTRRERHKAPPLQQPPDSIEAREGQSPLAPSRGHMRQNIEPVALRRRQGGKRDCKWNMDVNKTSAYNAYKLRMKCVGSARNGLKVALMRTENASIGRKIDKFSHNAYCRLNGNPK